MIVQACRPSVKACKKKAMATKIEDAKAALERIRDATNVGGRADPTDIEKLIGYLGESEKVVLGAVDLLRASQNAFRSKQVAKARELLEELL